MSAAPAPALPAPASARASAANLVVSLAGIAGLLVLWQIAPTVGWVRRTSVPPLSEVVPEVGDVLTDGRFYESLGASAGRWAVGLAIAVALGVTLGVLMGRSRVAFGLIDPVLTMLFPIPKVAFILLLQLWLGAGDATRITIIVLGAIIPITISSYHGAAAVDPKLLWSARSLGVGRAAALPRVVLPAALPQILSGIRIALPLSVFTLLASEFLVRTRGVGSYLFVSYENGDYLRTWATTTVVALLGFALDAAYSGAVRWRVPWLDEGADI